MNKENLEKSISLLNGCKELSEKQIGVLSEAFDLIKTLAPIAKESFRFVTGEEKQERFFTAECQICDWWGPSNQMLGGDPIADTRDYNDCVCPVCNSDNIEEIDGPVDA